MPGPARSDWFGEIIRTVATLLVACGLIGVWIGVGDRDRQFSERTRYGVLDHRFAKDNAVGATANAVEWIASQTSPPLIGNAIWLGLALWAINLLRRSRLAIERLADELAPVKADAPRGSSWFGWPRAGTPPLSLTEDDLDQVPPPRDSRKKRK